MGTKWGYWKIAGFVFTSALGTFLHFLFDLTGQNVAAGLFSAVNESIWEHMKLIYYPKLIIGITEWYFNGRSNSRFWCVKLAGILLAIIIIPLLYYTYTGALGVSADWFNIAIFFLAAGIAYWVEYKMLSKDETCLLGPRWSLAIILGIGILFSIFTFFPPHIPLFRDPLAGTYGYQ